MKVKIIFDKTRKLEKGNIELYSSETDYFDAYLSLQSAIKQKSDKSIIVYSEPLKTWLSKGLSKYKRAHIVEREVTYRDLLAAKWKVDYDIEISDHEILRDDLLSLPVEGVQKQSISSFVCQHFISPHMDTPEVNRTKFGELLTDLVQFQSEKSGVPQIVNTVYQYKVIKWLEASPDYADFIHFFTDGLVDLYEKSCLYKLTAKYPKSLQNKCLGQKWVKLFDKAKLNLDGLSIDHFEKTSTLYSSILMNELNLFYKTIERENPEFKKENIDQLISYSSGELHEELEYILNILKSNPSLIDNKLISRIKTTFTHLMPIYNQKVEELKSYVTPPKPSSFNKNGELEAVVDWAVREYLPYRFWLETTHKEDREILQYGSDFSKYIFQNYDKFSYHYQNSVYRFVFNYKEQISETPVPILLILDNFNYKFLELLQSSFAKHKMIPGKLEPYLSLLPTETSVAKIAIISGKRDKVDSKNYNYAKNLVEKWQEYFPNHKIKYLSKAGELDDYKTTGNEFIVVNYLEIDDELHKSYQKTAIEHRKTIAFIVENITELIATFIKRNNIENNARVFLISDHGSTLITQNIRNEIEIDYFKGKSIDHNHRFISMNDEKFQVMRNNDNISHAVFFLDKETSGDGENYMIAGAYNRFKEIKEDFYVHGGALPEEIIVPAGYFQYSEQDVKGIILQLLKEEYRLMTKEIIKLRIANPNNLELKNIYIEVFANELSLRDINIDEIQDQAEKEISAEIRIPNRNVKTFQIHVNYELAGKSYKQRFDCPIKIKTFAQPTFDFDEL